MTHITYETAKKLKEFLGKNAPEPMDDKYVSESGCIERHEIWRELGSAIGLYPAYQLHDLLRKPFCELLAKRYRYRGSTKTETWAEIIMHSFAKSYFYGGLSDVETSLIKLIGGEIE